MTTALLALGGAVAALSVLGLLVVREVRRVAAPAVTRPSPLTIRGRRLPWALELLLWVAAALLLVPRVVGLLF